MPQRKSGIALSAARSPLQHMLDRTRILAFVMVGSASLLKSLLRHASMHSSIVKGQSSSSHLECEESRHACSSCEGV